MKKINDDIYLVGKQNNISCYWLNGEITELSEQGENSLPNGIAVIDQNILISGTSEGFICAWENGVKKKIVKLEKNEHSSKYGFMKK